MLPNTRDINGFGTVFSFDFDTDFGVNFNVVLGDRGFCAVVFFGFGGGMMFTLMGGDLLRISD